MGVWQGPGNRRAFLRLLACWDLPSEAGRKGVVGVGGCLPSFVSKGCQRWLEELLGQKDRDVCSFPAAAAVVSGFDYCVSLRGT